MGVGSTSNSLAVEGNFILRQSVALQDAYSCLMHLVQATVLDRHQWHVDLMQSSKVDVPGIGCSYQIQENAQNLLDASFVANNSRSKFRHLK